MFRCSAAEPDSSHVFSRCEGSLVVTSAEVAAAAVEPMTRRSLSSQAPESSDPPAFRVRDEWRLHPESVNQAANSSLQRAAIGSKDESKGKNRSAHRPFLPSHRVLSLQAHGTCMSLSPPACLLSCACSQEDEQRRAGTGIEVCDLWTSPRLPFSFFSLFGQSSVLTHEGRTAGTSHRVASFITIIHKGQHAPVSPAARPATTLNPETTCYTPLTGWARTVSLTSASSSSSR